MDRSVTPEEAGVVQWLLEHASVGDITPYRLRPIEELRVVGGCDCGCSSLHFEGDRRGARIIADALAVYSDSQQAGLILWGREGEILSLEVYELHPGASCRFPEIRDLLTFEDRGRQLD